MGKNKWLLKGTLIGGALYIANQVLRERRRISLVTKTTLITGGSRGLGLVLARQLSEEGARVILTARDEKELAEAKKQLVHSGKKVDAIACDVTKPEEVDKLISEIKEKYGEIDILINNAGIIQVGPEENMQKEDFKKTMDVHFYGPLNLMNAVLPGMKQRRKGRIVNISSVGGKVAVPHLLPYSASKFALAGLSEGLFTELAEHGIRVTSVYPGLMRTGSPRNVDVKGRHEKEYAWFKIMDSLPIISINAERAAAKIVTAIEYGDKSLTLSVPAKVISVLHGIAPDLTLSLMDAANRVLPLPGFSDVEQKGYQSATRLSESILTKKTRKAEVKNNEI